MLVGAGGWSRWFDGGGNGKQFGNGLNAAR